MITISLVEDDAVCRGFLTRCIRSFKRVRLLSAYATGEEALERLPHEKPAVALMDIKLPGIDGIECVRRLRQKAPALTTQFMILTGHEDVNLIFESLEAGAHGFLVKDQITRAKLLVAIKDLATGGSPLSASVARKVVTSFEFVRHASIPLTSREKEILQYVLHGLINKEIGARLSISENTVHRHLATIYEKLHVHSRVEAALLFTQQQSQQRAHPTG